MIIYCLVFVNLYNFFILIIFFLLFLLCTICANSSQMTSNPFIFLFLYLHCLYLVSGHIHFFNILPIITYLFYFVLFLPILNSVCIWMIIYNDFISKSTGLNWIKALHFDFYFFVTNVLKWVFLFLYKVFLVWNNSIFLELCILELWFCCVYLFIDAIDA